MEVKTHPIDARSLVQGIQVMKQFFDRSTRCLEEADSSFAPKPEMFTVAAQVAHVAQTVPPENPVARPPFSMRPPARTLGRGCRPSW